MLRSALAVEIEADRHTHFPASTTQLKRYEHPGNAPHHRERLLVQHLEAARARERDLLHQSCAVHHHSDEHRTAPALQPGVLGLVVLLAMLADLERELPLQLLERLFVGERQGHMDVRAKRHELIEKGGSVRIDSGRCYGGA
jgi:hypothetical protein